MDVIDNFEKSLRIGRCKKKTVNETIKKTFFFFG